MTTNQTPGRPKQYTDKMIKKNLRLPEYVWKWLDGYAENRTKAMIKLYNQSKKRG